MHNYPRYITFTEINRKPTCVAQEFPNELNREDGKIFYPKSPKLEKYFLSEYQSLRFGAAQFSGFLHDTVCVEHHVVIPAIRDISLLPVNIPQHVQIDLFKLVTDEGHHAAQAMVLVNSIRDSYNVEPHEAGCEIPLFVRELEKHKNQYHDPVIKVIYNMLVGVVTETRISKELGSFVNNPDLLQIVREHCKSHQDDETIHCSQFMALGKHTWNEFNEEQRELAAEIYAITTLARSTPDISRISYYLSQTTGIQREECNKIVNSIYTRDYLIEEILIAIRSTIVFLKNLGVLDYKVARDIFQKAGVI